MSAEIIRGWFREPTIRPHMAKVQMVLDAVPDSDAGKLYTVAMGGIAGAEIGRKLSNHQMLVDGLTIAFFAIAGILNVPRGEAEGYLPDNVA